MGRKRDKTKNVDQINIKTFYITGAQYDVIIQKHGHR